MNLPKGLKNLIKRFEGCKLIAYLCPAKVWTIGYGATGKGITKGVTWTQPQAENRLDSDALVYAAAALKMSPRLALHEGCHTAIADFCYNLGTTRYKASTLKRKIDSGDLEGAREEIVKWVWGGGKKLPGLVLRRAEEAKLLR